MKKLKELIFKALKKTSLWVKEIYSNSAFIKVINEFFSNLESKVLYYKIQSYLKMEKIVKKKLGTTILNIKENILLSTLELLLIKMSSYLVFSQLYNPIINLSIWIFLIIINVKKRNYYTFREYYLVPAMQYLIGFNFYRHNVYDVIPDLDFRWEYQDNYAGTLYFYFDYFRQKVSRRIYFLLIQLRLLTLCFPLAFLFFQQIVFTLFVLK